MVRFFKNFAENESGATAIEYGLIAAGISVAIATIVGTVGDEVDVIFDKVLAGLKAA